LQSLSKTNQASRASRAHVSTARMARDGCLLGEMIGPLIKGDVSDGCSVLLFGPPGVGKTVFCENFVKACLGKNLNCLYVTLDKSPCDVKANLRHLGISVRGREETEIVFVDGFNWLVGESQETYRVDNLGNLTELSIQIASAAGSLSGPVFLIFDSISPLLVYNPENVVVKFLQILLARVRSWNGVGLFVVQDGVHSEGFCNTLSYLVDGVFDMKIEEENGEMIRYFRVRSLKSMAHETRWVRFVIHADRELELELKEGRTVGP